MNRTAEAPYAVGFHGLLLIIHFPGSNRGRFTEAD
jgi:hypothetical protein